MKPSIQTSSGTFYLGSAPSLMQQAFMDADEREQLFGGAKRGGKSVALCQKLIALGTSFPGNRLGLFRKDLTDLRESTLVSFEKICPKSIILDHHHTHRIIYLKTVKDGPPSTIHYGGLGGEDEIESAKSKEYGAFAIDEPTEIVEGTYLMLLAQLCWTLPEGYGFFDEDTGLWRPPYMAMMASNPEPGWLHRRFRSLIDGTSAKVPIRSDGRKIFIRSLPRDNPYLPKGWEQEQRDSAPEVWVNKYLEGSWEVSEGQVFKEFDRSTHCITSNMLLS